MVTKAWNDFFLATEFASLMIIVPGYFFIFVVYFLDWIKTKRLEISDQLSAGVTLLCLIHRFLQLGVNCTLFIYKVQMAYYTLLFVYVLYLVLILCTFHFSSLLAVHYCLKIVNFNQKLYIYLKHRFPKMFPRIFLPCVFVSLLISGPAAQNMSQLHLNSTNILLNHLPVKSILFLQLYFGACSISFFVFLVSVLFLLLSLYRHIQQRTGTIKAHVTAVKTLISLLIGNALYFILLLLTVDNFGGELVVRFLIFSYTFCHVIALPILIGINSKLRKKFWSIWSKFQCFKRADADG